MFFLTSSINSAPMVLETVTAEFSVAGAKDFDGDFILLSWLTVLKASIQGGAGAVLLVCGFLSISSGPSFSGGAGAVRLLWEFSVPGTEVQVSRHWDTVVCALLLGTGGGV